MLENFSVFKIIFVRFWCSIGSQLGSKLAPKTDQECTQERRRAARDGNRDGFESPWKDTEHPTRLGPPKAPPGTFKFKQSCCILKSNKVDFRHLFERVFSDSEPLLPAWLGSTFLTFLPAQNKLGAGLHHQGLELWRVRRACRYYFGLKLRAVEHHSSILWMVSALVYIYIYICVYI